MNVQGAPPTALVPTKPPRPRRTTKVRRRDLEFLPGALEILETPLAPLATTIILVLCFLFTSATVWAYFGRIDIISIAQGKLQPTGRVKTIQSLETGRVVVNNVENGSHVAAGDVLVELDQDGAKAEKDATEAELQGFQAEVLRRGAAISIARAGDLNAIPHIGWPSTISDFVRDREQRVIIADLTQLKSQLALFDAERDQKMAERQKLVSTVQAQQDLIKVLTERVAMRANLKNTNAFSRSNLLDVTETLRAQQATLVGEKGQIGEISASLAVINRESAKALQTFIADNAQKLDEAERQVATLTKKLSQAETKLRNLVVRSPIAGVVQSSTVTTAGQVVIAGEELMRIVPDDTTLEVEAYLPNADIGFVKVGQPAVIKVESFPFTRYGIVDAKVTRVARDAIPEPDASQLEADPAHPRRSNMPAGADRVQNLVFPVTLKLLETTVNVDGAAVPLRTGMAVTSEIRTGSRRILEYLLSPLVRTGSEALKER